MPRLLQFIFAAAFMAVWPLAAAPQPARLNLAGEWRFALDRAFDPDLNDAAAPTPPQRQQ